MYIVVLLYIYAYLANICIPMFILCQAIVAAYVEAEGWEGSLSAVIGGGGGLLSLFPACPELCAPQKSDAPVWAAITLTLRLCNT